MDFVDLDKVLDEFEEEEKAALSIVPGQELKPSGYIQFLEKHQAQEWDAVNTNSHPDRGYTLERKVVREPKNVSYDEPYDGFSQSKLDFIQNDKFSSLSSNGCDQINADELVITGTRVRGLKDHVDTKARRGTIASKTTEVQTDALTPNTERELASLMFPKSDIHVEGHVNSLTLNEENAAVRVNSDQNNSPIYASVDSSSLVHGNETVTSQSSSSSSVLQTNYIEDNKHTFSDYVDNETSCNERLKESQAGMNSGEGSQPMVGFDDVNDKDMGEEEVNMYLSELDGEFEGNFGSVNERTSSHINQSNHLGQNLAEELRDADVSKTAIQSVLINSSLEPNLSSEGNNQNHVPAAFSKVKACDTHSSYSESPDIVTDLGIRPKKHIDTAVVDKHAVLKSMMREKSEVETILDEKKQTCDINTTSVYEKMMWGRMEIEEVLNEALQNQQKENLQEQSQHSDGQNLPDFVQGYSDTSVAPVSQSEALSTSSLLTSTSVIGTSKSVDDLGKSSVNSNVISSSLSEATEASNSVPFTGAGARPKDLSAIRKIRPNTLLGLSKVNLDVSPTNKINDNNPSWEGDMQGEDSDSSSHFTTAAHKNVHNNEEPQSSTHHQLNTSCLQLEAQRIEDESKQRMHNAMDVPPPTHSQLEVEKVLDEAVATAVVPDSSQLTEPANSPLPEHQTEDDMKTDEEKTDDPSGVQKVVRPNVLNLPARPDFALAHSMDAEEEEMDQDAGAVGQQGHGAGSEPMAAVGVVATAGVAEGEVPVPVQTVPPARQQSLGDVAPLWIPDAEADACMTCNAKFTIWKRRHHCRACGKVLCSQCCSQRSLLRYMDNKEARVCGRCYQDLNNQAPAFETPPRSPNPNNPSEYCSKVPPNQQASGYQGNPPTVMVPTGVLKGSGSQRKSGEPKQVMFSDGIRPGGDLTELDGPDQSRLHRRAARSSRRAAQQASQNAVRKLKEESHNRSPCLVPEHGLPPLYISEGEIGHVDMDEDLNQIDYSDDYRLEAGQGITYAVNKNLAVTVKVINLDCCMNRVCWCYVSKGMASVGQSELVILLELTEDEATSVSIKPPRDIFMHYHNVYLEALKGNTIQDMGHTILHQSFLGSGEYGGFLYVRATFQCLNKLPLPEPPFLFGLLLQKWEAPWAKVFPIRLMLRLGAEFRYYPCPLIGVRNRKPVFYEIGHTIMNLLADFRNYQYFLTQIKGVKIHMRDKQTIITLPKNRYNEVMKVVRSSNEHVMAFGSSFSTVADSHLVCIQNEEGNYQTQAINIQNKPRLVTGASFVVFNGALKTSSGLRAKSSIVEDGVMVQILPEAMASLKQALKDMATHTIICGPLAVTEPEETLELKWVDSDKAINVGVKSYIDGTPLEGVESVSVKSVTDFVGENLAIRWTHLYFLRQDESQVSHFDPLDLTRLTEEIAAACCTALLKYLDELRSKEQVRIGLRVNLMRDSVGYEIGSKAQSLPERILTDLDTRLVPIIHQASEEGIILELVFHILD